MIDTPTATIITINKTETNPSSVLVSVLIGEKSLKSILSPLLCCNVYCINSSLPANTETTFCNVGSFAIFKRNKYNSFALVFLNAACSNTRCKLAGSNIA